MTDMVIALGNDDVLGDFGLVRGSMSLVDNDKQREILECLKGRHRTMSVGGSAANTIRALAHLGVTTGLIGKVGCDDTGDFFEKALGDLGARPVILRGVNESGHCLSMVSADGERTMATCLGAALEFSAEDVKAEMFDGFDLLYVEGYQVQNHEAVSRTVEVARECGLKVAIDLASFNVVEENREFLLGLVRDGVDMVFANEEEAAAFGGGMTAEEALEFAGDICELAVVKVGGRGALIRRGEECVKVGVVESARRVDTTGAGDFFAAGFLAGLCRGWSLDKCGVLGAVVAGKVIEVEGTTLDEEVWREIGESAERIGRGDLLGVSAERI